MYIYIYIYIYIYRYTHTHTSVHVGGRVLAVTAIGPGPQHAPPPSLFSALCATPNLRIKIISTKVASLKLSRKFPADMIIPSL